MKRALLYCPMNPPAAGTLPSGDRAMAGLLSRALDSVGYDVETASALRSYDAAGNAARQHAILSAARTEIDRVIARHRAAPPAVWVTYMNYYKSPDHLGPVIARALEIPYLIVEASDAPKRATGHFAAPYAAAKKALEAADAVCALTALDATGLAKIVAPDRLRRLPPFIDDAAFRAPAGTHRDPHRIVSTAMLRPGKKLANFPLVADALARIADLDWRYAVAGDGAGRPEVEAALRRLPTDRVDLRGRITPDAIPAFYASAGIYLWPGLREGYGLAYLEAQACATPVVACDGAGVPAVVEHGRGGLLSPTGDAGALASSLRRLLTDEPYRASLGETAEAFVHRERTIAGAAARLRTIMSEIGA